MSTPELNGESDIEGDGDELLSGCVGEVVMVAGSSRVCDWIGGMPVSGDRHFGASEDELHSRESGNHNHKCRTYSRVA